jgi:serine/threonine-protein kinase
MLMDRERRDAAPPNGAGLSAPERRGEDSLEDTLQAPGATIRPEPRAEGDEARRLLAAVPPLRAVADGGPAPARVIIEQTIGQGGMGVVRLGTQTAIGRKVAVKTLRPERRDEAQAIELLREAWITGALEHPNVVPIYDVGLDEQGAPVIVLKRIEGVPWLDLMGDAAQIALRFGAHDALEWNLRIFLQVASAVELAHSRGIVHRDLKPENVMVGEFGQVFVLDWGIAVSLRDDPNGRLPLARDARKIAGTPAYMAPEMLTGCGEDITERTDIYLLGATLYEILAGHPPHQGERLVQVFESVRRSAPAEPAGAPPELWGIVRRAMAKEPADRFASVAELRAAVSAFLSHQGSARLAEEATARLNELTGEGERPSMLHLGAIETGDPTGTLYHLFGQCRFGFEAALREWPENEVAREGLVRATSWMVSHEIERGDSRSAAVLLSGLASPPPELAARVAEAEARRIAEEARRRDLEARHDPQAGGRLRFFLAIVVGAIFVLMPIAVRMPLSAAGHTATHAGLAGLALALLVPILGLAAYARKTLPKTVLNRTIVAMVIFVPVSQAVLHLGAGAAGVPVLTCELLTFFLWFVLAATFSITVERRLWVSAAGYLVAFAAAVHEPAWRYPLMSLANLVLTASLVVVWSRAARAAAP